MPVPILTHLIPALLGDRQSDNVILLSQLYSSGGSSDVYIDKRGRIAQVAGWTKKNVSAIVTNTGNTTGTFRNLFQLKRVGGGTTTRILVGVLDDAVNEWEIWRSADEGATWTFVSDRGATPIGLIPDFAQFGDTLIITVPKTEIPRVYDGTTLSAAGGTQMTTATSVAGTTGLLSGAYQWKIVPRKTDGTRKPGSLGSTILPLSLKRASLSWAADADTTVSGYEIYRTTGTGKIYYFVDFVEGRLTLAFVDNIPDVTIIAQRALEEHGDAPPSGIYFVEIHKQRAWFYRTDTDPRTIWYSDVGDFDSVYPENKVDLTDADSFGDVGVGSTGNFEGMHVCWQEYSVWVISGTFQVVETVVDLNRRRTNAQMGTVSHRTVLRIPKGARFVDAAGIEQVTERVTLAYLTPAKDIRLFDGNNDTIISFPIKDTLSTLDHASRRKCHSVLDRTRGHATFYFPSESATECDTAVLWDYIHGTWHPLTAQTFSSVIEVESASEGLHLCAAEARIATGGFAYELWDGNTRDGVQIDPVFTTKPLYLPQEPGGPPDYSHTKRHRWVDLLFEKDATPEIALVGVMAHDEADGGALVFTVAETSGSSQQRVKLRGTSSHGRYHHSVGLRLRISKRPSDLGGFILNSLIVGYQVLPGLKR